MTLQPCSQCRRHFSIDEAVCPFCATPRESAPSRTTVAGRFSRAAVFAGLAGCYTSNPPPQYQQQPPPPPPPDNPQPPPDDSHFAQPPAGTGSIRGNVTEGSAPLAYVGVRLEGSGQARAAKTDERGQYMFVNLPPGTYTIIVNRTSNPRVGPPRRQVNVTDGATAQADFAIALPPPYDYSNSPKPYGAPPARRRVV